MPPTESEQYAASFKALETAHSIIAGHRDLAYRIVIAQVTLLAALCVAAKEHPPTPRWWVLPAWAWVLSLAAVVLSLLSDMWLRRIKGSVDVHLEVVDEQWRRWGIPWPRTGADRSRSTHGPLVWFVRAAGAAAVAWVVATALGDP